LVIVFVGFAPSFYLPPLAASANPGMPPGPPLYVHIHGALMTTWYLLFVLQTGLVARGRRDPLASGIAATGAGHSWFIGLF